MRESAPLLIAVALLASSVAGRAQTSARHDHATTDTGASEAWVSRLRRQVSPNCGNAAAYAEWHRGPRIMMDEHCARHSIVVRNDSSTRIQCKTLMEYREIDYSGRKVVQTNSVVFEKSEYETLVSYTKASRHPTRYSAECTPLPPAPPEPLADTEICRPQMSGASPHKFYPEYLRRRKVEGTVTIEFTASDYRRLEEPRVVESSGEIELDNAALDYSEYLRAQSRCVGRPVRIRIRFLADEKRIVIR